MSKQQEIAKLETELARMNENKRKLTTEMEASAEKRDKLNQQAKHLREEITSIRNKRDKANQEVKDLKETRSIIKTEIHEEIEKLKQLREDAKILLQTLPSKDMQALQKEFDSIEWKIQTTPMTLQEEKDLLKKAKPIKIRLDAYKKLEKLSQKIRNTQNEVETLRSKENTCHQKLTQTAQEGQELHQKMLIKIEEAKKIRADADVAHQDFINAKEQLKSVQEAIAEVLMKIRQLKLSLQEKQNQERKKTEEAIAESLEKQAREKLKRGEKLNWEEFQILAQKGVEAQD